MSHCVSLLFSIEAIFPVVCHVLQQLWGATVGAHWSGAQGEGLLQGEEVQQMSSWAATLRLD